MRHCLLFLLMLNTCSIAQAHDLWLEVAGKDYLLLQGHRHASHAGADTQAYDPAHVEQALCVDAQGRQRALAIGSSHPLRFAGPCAVLQVRFVSGYWTKTPWGTQNLPRTGISGVLRSWHASESLKRIEQWNTASAKPIGLGLEITPLRDPFALKPGDKLTVLITDDGKPLAGAPVAYGGETRGQSGADGQIAIRLRHAGVQLLSSSVESPLHDGKADIALRSTALQFEISP